MSQYGCIICMPKCSLPFSQPALHGTVIIQHVVQPAIRLGILHHYLCHVSILCPYFCCACTCSCAGHLAAASAGTSAPAPAVAAPGWAALQPSPLPLKLQGAAAAPGRQCCAAGVWCPGQLGTGCTCHKMSHVHGMSHAPEHKMSHAAVHRMSHAAVHGMSHTVAHMMSHATGTAVQPAEWLTYQWVSRLSASAPAGAEGVAAAVAGCCTQLLPVRLCKSHGLLASSTASSSSRAWSWLGRGQSRGWEGRRGKRAGVWGREGRG